jgi:hypothetical protein
VALVACLQPASLCSLTNSTNLYRQTRPHVFWGDSGAAFDLPIRSVLVLYVPRSCARRLAKTGEFA